MRAQRQTLEGRTPRPASRLAIAAIVAVSLVTLVTIPQASSAQQGPPPATSASPAPPATHLDVRLRLTSVAATSAGETGATTAQVVSATEAPGSVPQARSRRITPRQVLVVGLDAQGVERWHSIQPDPRIVRSEAVDEDGTISGTTLAAPTPELRVAVPLSADVSTLRVLERAPGSTDTQLSTVAEAPLEGGEATSATADNRVDIAIVGDGYTSAQLGDFADDVATVEAGFVEEDPWKEYAPYLRFHRVDVASAQSGADHPERNPAKYVSTAFDATYNCSGIQRLICVDETKVFDKLDDTLTAGQQDIVLVLVNDTEYGGSGGVLGVASLHPSALELVRHELGHSFGGLADEYGGDTGPSCDPTAPDDVNVTNKTTRTAAPWKAWIAAGTPVPTTTTTAGVPGLYLGGRYCDAGLYRPTYDSKMRTLDRPYEQINTEQLIKRMYSFVSPIDASSPTASAITPAAGGSQTFTVTPLAPATHTLGVAWTVDGASAGTATSLTRSFAQLGPGNHTITATVTDATSAVRNDPEKLLVATRTWHVVDTKAPFASWNAFVDRAYRDVLGRAPTSGELAYVAGSLTSGTSSKGSVVDTLRRGTDNTTNVDPTARLYRAFLGRIPDAGGLKFWIGRRRAGTWTLTKMADQFAASNEFKTKYGALTNRQFVTRIYTDVMGRTPDSGGVDFWTSQLDTGRRTRGGVMIGFSESNEYKTKQAQNTDVAAAYVLLMGRAPTADEAADWVARQTAGTTHLALLLELMDSAKYATHITG